MSGVLGLGQGQAASLNNELIEKLKVVDTKAYINPLVAKIEKIPLEREELSNINKQVNYFLDSIKGLSANQTIGINVFDSKEANTSGDSVKFDVENLQSIKVGSTNVNVLSLAQKDVYQSNKIANENDVIGGGDFTISLGSNSSKTFDTSNMTYKQLSTELNKLGLSSSIDKIGTNANNENEFRLVIKSKDSGVENKINLSGDLTSLGFNDVSNHVLKAQDMKMKVDGVEYSNSTNNLVVDGLKISATKIGESSITIEEDKNSIVGKMKEFKDKFNELNNMLEKTIYDTNSNITNKGQLKDIMDTLKSKLFGSGNSNISIFSVGFSLDSKTGGLDFDEKTFTKELQTNKETIESLFIGVPEKKGIGTEIDEAISVGGITKNLLDYDLNILSRETNLNKERDLAMKNIDSKYQQLATQFSAYGAMINQMEGSFAGFKMMIQQSYSNK